MEDVMNMQEMAEIPQSVTIDRDGDYVVLSGTIDDLNEITSCNISNSKVACESGNEGTKTCKIPTNYPNYQGDILFQSRRRRKTSKKIIKLPKLPRGTCNNINEQLQVNIQKLYLLLLKYPIFWQCVAEFMGTGFIVLFGCGSVASAVLTGSLVGLWQVAVVWTFGVSLSIYATASISGAHLNPAVSFAFAIFRRKQFPFYKLFPYMISQLLGAMTAAAILLALFSSQIDYVLSLENASRSSNTDIAIQTASMFGEYFPNPGFKLVIGKVTILQALSIESFGTGVLMFMILVLTDNRNKAVRNKDFAPFLIGATVGVLISIFAPYTQAGWNPARDFGPRLIACMAGWGKNAIPGPENGFWIYILGPFIGSVIGTIIYDIFISLGLNAIDINNEEED